MNTLVANQSINRNFSFFNWKIILRMFLILSFLSISVLLLFYIFQVNSEVSGRYLIQKYEKDLTKIIGESQGLEMSLIQSNSLDNVMGSMESLNFVKISKIYYIKVLNNQVVKK
ncbi:MAG: hypothetical protein ABH956_02425 [Candidatus Nealsonbacteria bacterium]